MPALTSQLRPGLILLAIFTLVFGGIYPWLSKALVESGFHADAEDSLVRDRDGRILASSLVSPMPLGASDTPDAFWSSIRVPGASPCTANADLQACRDLVAARLAALKAMDPANVAAVPPDLVKITPAGVTPTISPAAADYQRHRVAIARHCDDAVVESAIRQSTHNDVYDTTGTPAVNVLELNLRLDGRLT